MVVVVMVALALAVARAVVWAVAWVVAVAMAVVDAVAAVVGSVASGGGCGDDVDYHQIDYFIQKRNSALKKNYYCSYNEPPPPITTTVLPPFVMLPPPPPLYPFHLCEKSGNDGIVRSLVYRQTKGKSTICPSTETNGHEPSAIDGLALNRGQVAGRDL